MGLVTGVTVGRADLAWALRAVLPHAAHHREMLPVLAAVRATGAGTGDASRPV